MAFDLDVLQKAYTAFADSVANYYEAPLTASPWRRVLRYDELGQFANVPRNDIKPQGPNEIPCVQMWPSSQSPSWFLESMMNFPLNINVAIWTPRLEVRDGLRYCMLVVRAVHKWVAPAQTVPEVKRVTGYYPMGYSPISWGKDGFSDKGAKLTKISMQIALRVQVTPYL